MYRSRMRKMMPADRKTKRAPRREFEPMAGYVEISPRAITREIRKRVERANAAWPGLLKELSWLKGVTTIPAAR
jgi:hypothetical protein